jgi:hypothetical protein
MAGHEAPNSDTGESSNGGPDLTTIEGRRQWQREHTAARQQYYAAKHEKRLKALAPKQAFEISPELYNKAQTQNNELSEDEVCKSLLFQSSFRAN